MMTTIIGTEATHRSGIGDFGATRESKLSLESDPVSDTGSADRDL